jgi:hypothetical protein
MLAMKPARDILAGLLLCASLIGCVTREAELVRTDDYFSPSEAAARPSVFLDRRPVTAPAGL